MRSVFWGAALSIVVMVQPAVRAEGWKVGLAQRKITPQQPVYLAGYASRNKPFESVADDLYVKAMALDDGQGHRAVLITSDTIGYRAEFAEPICARIEKQTGLARSQILLGCSHTHTGPRLSLDPTPRARDMTEQQARDTVAYTRQLMEDTIAVAVEALEKMVPSRLSYGMGVAPFVMNRRQFTPRGVRLGVNPRGLADRSVPMLKVDSSDGQLRAVLYGVACHNTTLTGRHYLISGDFAGLSQAYVQHRYPGAQAMFMIGCAGSANPYPRGQMKDAQAHGEQLGAEVFRLIQSKLRPVAGPLKTELDYVDLPLQDPPSAEEIDRLAAGQSGWRAWVAKQMKSILQQEGKLPTCYHCPVAVWQFGQDLTLVALSGEVVVDYVPLLERALGPLNLWVAAYCNDVFGYIPSAQVLADGGYETRGVYAGGIGFFAPEAQDLLVEKVRQLAGRAGRAMPD